MIGLARQKGFDRFNFAALELGQFRQLDKPLAQERLRGVFVVQVREAIRKPRITGEGAPDGTFQEPLLPFQDGHGIHLAAGLQDARHGGNQRLRAHGPTVGGVGHMTVVAGATYPAGGTVSHVRLRR